MNKQFLSMYGLKFNPFAPSIPHEALLISPQISEFCLRVEKQVMDGGFAMITGPTGAGKTSSLRYLSTKLSLLADVAVGVLALPCCSLVDFYREIGELYNVPISPNNRWCNFKAIRKKWQEHLQSTLYRPVLLIDEAQDARPHILSEIRMLCSAEFDTRLLLTVVLCGDNRLLEKLKTEELLPLGNRICSRLVIDYASTDDLKKWLLHVLEQAGHPQLMTPDLIDTLCLHAAGNYRILANMAHELLLAGVSRQATKLDDKLYLEVFAHTLKPSRKERAKLAH